MSDPRIEEIQAAIEQAADAPAQEVQPNGQAGPAAPVDQPRIGKPLIQGVDLVAGAAVSNIATVNLKPAEVRAIRKIAARAFTREFKTILKQIGSGKARGRKPGSAKKTADPNAPKKPRGRPRKSESVPTPTV